MTARGSDAEVRPAVELAGLREAEIIELRRWFHRRPEPSFHETETAAKIRAVLEELGIEYRTAGETGTVGVIRGTEDGPVVALRADIDALEIEEENDVPFRSQKPGLMHACGHDSHTAALLAAARILREEREKLCGTVKLVFQPAEELGRGAAVIRKSGLVGDAGAFFGLHVTPSLRTGQISLAEGPIMAGANSLHVVLRGRSGHAAAPQETRDAVAAGSAVVTALQQIVARETDPVSPVVVSIGMFRAGTRGNIIADRAELTGTVRVVSEEERIRVSEAVKRVVGGVAAAYGVRAETECGFATGIVVNSAELLPTVRRAALRIVPESDLVRLPIRMTTDDFWEYREIAPSFYALVGADGGPPSLRPAPLHSGSFLLDEAALPIETALYVEFARSFFAETARKWLPGIQIHRSDQGYENGMAPDSGLC